MRVLPFGDRALRAEYDDLASALAAYRALHATRPSGVVALIPAARTVLVRVDPAVLPLGSARRWLNAIDAEPGTPASASVVTVPVRYDGPDIKDAAEALGMSGDELVRRHAECEWSSAFVGFAPGFSYLVSDRWRFTVPRLATSRPAVPSGAVALAAEFTGIYPRSSPGGWRIIGSTDSVLWDESRDDPALLPPGTRVRFEAVP